MRISIALLGGFSGMNEAPLMAAYDELRFLANAEHVPPGIKSALLGLSECQTKLFCTVFVGGLTLGTADETIRLEPSNLLSELILAMTALDWPQVMILVHKAHSTPAAA
jgi:hypothetical protein